MLCSITSPFDPVCWKCDYNFRRWILERKLADAEVSEEEQNNLLKYLEQKETEYMRLQRHKMGADDFELLTIIGRGAFGEVIITCFFCYHGDNGHAWRNICLFCLRSSEICLMYYGYLFCANTTFVCNIFFSY